MKKFSKMTQTGRNALDIDFIFFMVRLTALLVLILSLSFVSRAGQFTRTETPQHTEVEDFPNAIRITKADMDTMMVGNDPYGILNYLSLKTGLTFRSTGDFGAEDWFTVRGFGRDNSRLTLVLVDGRPINIAGNHTVEFGDIPVSLIEEIVIYPGPVPSQYGGFQFVVDIKTRLNEEIAEASASVGSLNTYWLNTTVAGSGRFYYRANLDVNLSDGQTGQQLLGVMDHYTYSNRFDKAVLPSLVLGYEVSENLDISLQGNFYDVKKMFGSGLHYGLEQSRERTGQAYSLNLQPGRNSSLDYNLNLYLMNEEEFLNTEFPEDTTYYVAWGNQERQKYGINGYYRHHLLPGTLWLKAGAEAHWATGSTDNEEYLYYQFEDEQSFYGAFLQAGIKPWDGGRFIVGARLDGQSYLDDVFISPHFAFSQNLLSEQLQVYGTYGVNTRWLPLNKVNNFNRPPRPLGPPFLFGNVDLPVVSPEMERMRGVDVGVRTRLLDNRLKTRINYFYLANEGTAGAPLFEIRPVLEGAEVPPGFDAALVAYARNMPAEEINEGIEFHVEYRPIPRLKIFANATYTIFSETVVDDDIELYQGPLGGEQAQDFINEAVGQFVIPYAGRSVIPGAYDWLANLAAAYSFDNGMILNMKLRYRSESVDPLMKFNLDPQVDQIDPFLLTDIGGSIPLVQANNYRIDASARISNLFDTEYSTFVHYPMVGRFISAGISMELK